MLSDCGLVTEDERRDYFDAGVIAVLLGHLQRVAALAPRLSRSVSLAEWLFDRLIGRTFVGIRHTELSTEFQPAMLAACKDAGRSFPSRTVHAVMLVASNDAFPEIANPFQQLSDCTDHPDHAELTGQLCECLLESWRGLPPLEVDERRLRISHSDPGSCLLEPVQSRRAVADTFYRQLFKAAIEKKKKIFCSCLVRLVLLTPRAGNVTAPLVDMAERTPKARAS